MKCGGISLTRGFSCCSGRNVEKSLLIITYVVRIAFAEELRRTGAAAKAAERRVHGP